MHTNDRVWIWIRRLLIALVIGYCLLLATFILPTGGRLPRIPERVSPVEGLRLEVASRRGAKGGEWLVFTVVDRAGKRTAIDRAYAARHNTEFAWDDKDRLWVYSSDIGTYAYEFSNGAWVELADDVVDALPAPTLVREAGN